MKKICAIIISVTKITVRNERLRARNQSGDRNDNRGWLAGTTVAQRTIRRSVCARFRYAGVNGGGRSPALSGHARGARAPRDNTAAFRRRDAAPSRGARRRQACASLPLAARRRTPGSRGERCDRQSPPPPPAFYSHSTYFRVLLLTAAYNNSCIRGSVSPSPLIPRPTRPPPRSTAPAPPRPRTSFL